MLLFSWSIRGLLGFLWLLPQIARCLKATFSAKPLYYGFDFGTSGVRCCLIDSSKTITHEDSLLWASISTADPGTSNEGWDSALKSLLERTPNDVRKDIARICISGTSSTALVFDANSKSITRKARMYDYNVVRDESTKHFGEKAITKIRSVCPSGSATDATSSTLAKLLSWHYENPILSSERLVHQSDWLAQNLIHDFNPSGTFVSDWNNALKLGYEVLSQVPEYPQWLVSLLKTEGVDVNTCFPSVIEPGRVISTISKSLADRLGLPESCEVVAGTTDSIAAFIASGADKPGQAVSSLGSTLAIKMLSTTPVSDSSLGIYSHKLGDQWLVGGASNVGCAVLRQEKFSNDELKQLSEHIDPNTDSPLKYYPLTKVGERFPVSDATKEPVLSPKPLLSGGVSYDVVLSGDDGKVSRGEYLHGILQGIAEVEREGYKALESLGASKLTEVLTAGGGSQNPVWTKMRERLLGVPTRSARGKIFVEPVSISCLNNSSVPAINIQIPVCERTGVNVLGSPIKCMILV